MMILGMVTACVLAAIGDAATHDQQLDQYRDSTGNIDYEKIEEDNRFWDAVMY